MPGIASLSPCRLPAAGCVVALVAACSGVTIDADAPPAAPPLARLLVVGEISAPDPAAERLVRRFRRDLVDALADDAPVARITARRPEPLPDDALVLTGRFEEIDAGNEFVRLAVGLGAGGPTLAGRFQISDAGGRPLLRFGNEAHPGQGRGFSAHWSPFDPDAAIADFADETAGVVIDWLNGEAL